MFAQEAEKGLLPKSMDAKIAFSPTIGNNTTYYFDTLSNAMGSGKMEEFARGTSDEPPVITPS